MALVWVLYASASALQRCSRHTNTSTFSASTTAGMLLRFRDLGEVGIKRGISSFGQTCWQRKTYMRRANIDFI